MPAQRDAHGKFIKGSGSGGKSSSAPAIRIVVDDTKVQHAITHWTEEIYRATLAAVGSIVLMVHSSAVLAIRNGAKSGRTYDRTFFRDKNGKLRLGPPRAGRNLSATHKASAPGEAPATDTGKLIGSLSFGIERGPGFVRGRVFAGAKYARWLEYGTKYMKERPFLRPALAANREKALAALAAAIKAATNKPP